MVANIVLFNVVLQLGPIFLEFLGYYLERRHVFYGNPIIGHFFNLNAFDLIAFKMVILRSKSKAVNPTSLKSMNDEMTVSKRLKAI